MIRMILLWHWTLVYLAIHHKVTREMEAGRTSTIIKVFEPDLWVPLPHLAGNLAPPPHGTIFTNSQGGGKAKVTRLECGHWPIRAQRLANINFGVAYLEAAILLNNLQYCSHYKMQTLCQWLEVFPKICSQDIRPRPASKATGVTRPLILRYRPHAFSYLLTHPG